MLIEALASGLPVAAYPVTGPVDIVTRPELGALDEDLGAAVERALRTGNPAACAEEGRTYTWENCTRQFVSNLVPVADGKKLGRSPAPQHTTPLTTPTEGYGWPPPRSSDTSRTPRPTPTCCAGSPAAGNPKRSPNWSAGTGRWCTASAAGCSGRRSPTTRSRRRS